MNSRSIEYVVEVARQRSFTKAAALLNISQQGLSRAVKAMEAELGVTLFARTSKQVALTEEGAALLPLLQDASDACQKVSSAAFALRRSALGFDAATVTACATPYFNIVVKELLADELAAAGADDVSVQETDVETAIARVQGDPHSTVAAVVVRKGELADLLKQTGLEFFPLFATQLGTWVSNKLASPKKASFTRGEIGRLPLAYFNDPFTAGIMRSTFGDGALQHTVACTSNWAALLKMAEEGRAALITDTFTTAFLARNSKDTFPVAIRNAPKFAFGFLHSPDLAPDSPGHAYLEAIESCLRAACGMYLQNNPVMLPQES